MKLTLETNVFLYDVFVDSHFIQLCKLTVCVWYNFRKKLMKLLLLMMVAEYYRVKKKTFIAHLLNV